VYFTFSTEWKTGNQLDSSSALVSR